VNEFREGRATVARLKEQSHDNAALRNDLAWFDDQIASLERGSAAQIEAVQPEQAAQ